VWASDDAHACSAGGTTPALSGLFAVAQDGQTLRLLDRAVQAKEPAAVSWLLSRPEVAGMVAHVAASLSAAAYQLETDRTVGALECFHVLAEWVLSRAPGSPHTAPAVLSACARLFEEGSAPASVCEEVTVTCMDLLSESVMRPDGCGLLGPTAYLDVCCLYACHPAVLECSCCPAGPSRPVVAPTDAVVVHIGSPGSARRSPGALQLSTALTLRTIKREVRAALRGAAWCGVSGE